MSVNQLGYARLRRVLSLLERRQRRAYRSETHAYRRPSLPLSGASVTLQTLSITKQMKVCPVCERKFPDKMTLCSADASVLKRLDDPHLGQTLAGKYKIEKLIKTGGMGSVYRGGMC